LDSLVSARTRRVLLDTLRTKPVRFVALAIVNFLVLDVLIALRPGFAVQAACVMSVTALIWFVILRANPVRNATWQDPLTGLADGTLLRDRLARAVARADAGARGVVLVVANLDDFRKINERYGDGAGDDILRGVAWRLLKDTRKCDTVVRLGADEFAVMAEGISDPSSALTLAESLLAALQRPYSLDGATVRCNASIGTAMTAEGRPADDLLGDAHLAMRDAKARGKGSCVEYQPSMHAASLERMLVQNGLYDALRNDELVLHYQPIVDLQSQHVVSVEALVRWKHPVAGLLGPDDFIPIAEGCGLIVPIGAWVVSESCRQLAQWNAALPYDQPLRVNVNLSSRQLLDDALVDIVDRALHENRVAPGLLTLELTETAAVHDVDEAARILGRLKALGVRIALDDFGTGSSSLGYLHRLPVDTIKLDKSLIDEVPGSASAGALARALPGLARALRLSVVVEGIERSDQVRYLQAAGYQLAQGYFFAPPLEPRAVEHVLHGRLSPPNSPRLTKKKRTRNGHVPAGTRRTPAMLHGVSE